MRDENGIIAGSVEVQRGPDGESVVVLDGERRVRLGAEEARSRALLQVLEALGERRHPVYVEVEPGTDVVARVLIPRITRVDRIEERDRELVLQLAGSHAVVRLGLDEPASDEVVAEVRRSAESRSLVLVVEDERHRVLDVVAFTPAPDGPELPPFPHLPVLKPDFPRPPFWRWWWGWLIWWLWWRWLCPSLTRAQAAFDQMSALTCAPITAPAPCITFMYPDDGCFARAHEMCRLMRASGLRPGKIWNYESSGHVLHVDTRNHPSCFVEWWYHVAPTLCVRTGPWWWPFLTTRMVIDPALFTGPVTTTDWKAIQQDPGSTLTPTGWEPFWPDGTTDPTFSETNYWLGYFRLQVVLRSAQSGPPPYTNC
jgi:hypothetical protein